MTKEEEPIVREIGERNWMIIKGWYENGYWKARRMSEVLVLLKKPRGKVIPSRKRVKSILNDFFG